MGTPSHRRGRGVPGPEPLLLDAAAARRVALAASGIRLHRPEAGGFEADPSTVETRALAEIRRLGSVQIDTISVVERAHHHILWARVPDWRTELLPRLETEPRRIFEYWSHAAAYLPLEDWRFCLPRMERIRSEGHPFFGEVPDISAEVLDRIRAEGPLSTRAWEDPREKRGGWWEWKPAKMALEFLFQTGELMTVTRRGFQKVFDLRERVLPSWVERRPPDGREMGAWHLERAKTGLGIFALRDVAYGRKDGLGDIETLLAEELEGGGLLPCRVAGTEEGRSSLLHYLPAGREGRASEAGEAPGAAVLSPFDPLIIDRRRLSRLFGFEYQIECYTPAAKRKFGYFGLPLLLDEGEEGPRIVGLLDAKHERVEGLLRLRRIALYRPRPPRGAGSSGARARAEAAAALGEALAAYAEWQGARELLFERVEIEDPVLERLLRAEAERRLRRRWKRRG